MSHHETEKYNEFMNETKNYFDVKERITIVEYAVINMKEILIEMKQENKDMKGEMRDFRKIMHSNFVWFLGIMLGGFVSLFGLMAHGFKWII